MAAELIWLLTVFSIPTLVAGISMCFLGTNTYSAIRKSFIVLLYINPWNWGSSFDWNRQATKREAFFIVWFVVFIGTLIVLDWRK